MKKIILLVFTILFCSFSCKENVILKKEIISYRLTATMYNPVKSQCDKDPLITAGMFKIKPKSASKQKYIALSRNLLKRWGGKFNYGDIVKIKNAGFKDDIYKVVDCMNKRFRNRIDILETKGVKSYKFKNVIIEKV